MLNLNFGPNIALNIYMNYIITYVVFMHFSFNALKLGLVT